MTLAVARALRELALIGCIVFLFVGATLWRVMEGTYLYDDLLTFVTWLTFGLIVWALGDYANEVVGWVFGRVKQWRLS